MTEIQSLQQLQRWMLMRSIYLLVAPMILMFTALACGTVVSELPYYTCPTTMAQPTATVLPGTLLPPPLPSSTPYTIAPPQDFYIGDAVLVGQEDSEVHLRFRLQDVAVQTVDSNHLVTWQLEVSNLGTQSYETIPPALMLITRINTAYGEQSGTWHTSEAAMNAADLTHENYDPLPPGATRIYRLAAYVPAGSVSQFAYLLDGDGENRITWANTPNPYC
ncbi:hypothetical protein G4Y79_18810 [Phototrophicus methaneseepsis]|uniref:DUF4352 domain-containing protein n=1 Tax=Phototrophicus methaneseepsis TaxID=2710758 RepID=A0A7S8E7C8_9CHLR|nr:hypothetical protein [Phototrophicus methaneseepsis]QPC81723.1 hypothetical protein G4Y79_18810 [Phototrophicus methaneseepsis]